MLHSTQNLMCFLL